MNNENLLFKVVFHHFFSIPYFVKYPSHLYYLLMNPILVKFSAFFVVVQCPLAWVVYEEQQKLIQKTPREEDSSAATTGRMREKSITMLSF